MNDDRTIAQALSLTRVLKLPRQKLSTFGVTNIDYYMLSVTDETHTRLRRGKVISRRPEILRIADIKELFEGFGDNQDNMAEEMFRHIGRNPRILNYRFKNEPVSSETITESFPEVYRRIRKEVERKDLDLTSILKGDDQNWQISVMKLIVDITMRSAGENIAELEQHGMFSDQKGVPENIYNRIEYLFSKAEQDRTRISELGDMLNKYKLFEEYEDRFFTLMNRKGK